MLSQNGCLEGFYPVLAALVPMILWAGDGPRAYCKPQIDALQRQGHDDEADHLHCGAEELVLLGQRRQKPCGSVCEPVVGDIRRLTRLHPPHAHDGSCAAHTQVISPLTTINSCLRALKGPTSPSIKKCQTSATHLELPLSCDATF